MFNRLFSGLNLGGFWFEKLRFANPEWLALIPVLLLIAGCLNWLRIRRSRLQAAIPVPSIEMFRDVIVPKHVMLLSHGGSILRALIVLLLILAMARPQVGRQTGSRSTEGIDIMLVIDTSGSMKARDFEIDGERPNRLEVIKRVIAEFIASRPDDRIGLVVFGTEAFTQAPLTLDHEVLLQFLEHVEIGMAGEATAIGDGLGTAVARLKDQPGQSKVTVLLTDGANNAGRMDPYAAAAAAKTFDVRTYTIGVGSKGDVPIVSNGRVVYIRADIDEPLMNKIADDTGGIYRRVTDTEALKSVYKEIDQLEKKKMNIKDQSHGTDVFYIPLIAALVALSLLWLWNGSRWRVVPV